MSTLLRITTFIFIICCVGAKNKLVEFYEINTMYYHLLVWFAYVGEHFLNISIMEDV